MIQLLLLCKLLHSIQMQQLTWCYRRFMQEWFYEHRTDWMQHLCKNVQQTSIFMIHTFKSLINKLCKLLHWFESDNLHRNGFTHNFHKVILVAFHEWSPMYEHVRFLTFKKKKSPKMAVYTMKTYINRLKIWNT